MYVVRAKRHSNKVEFTLDATSPKDALKNARTEAANIFDCQDLENEFSVEVKEIIEKEQKS